MKIFTNSIKTLSLLLVMALACDTKAQCPANFSYTVGTNGNVSFISTSAPVNSITTQYYWNFGNSTTFSAIGSPLASTNYSANGIYTVTLFFITPPTCSNSISYTINVNTVNTSTCNINANFNYSQGTNGLVNFNNTTTGTVSGVTYLWNFGDNTPTSNAFSPSHTYSANGTYIATLTANNNLSVTCVDTQTMAVIVNSYCTVLAGFTYSINGGSVSFFNTSTPSVGLIYSWNFGNSLFSNATNPSTTYTANGNYTVTLTAATNSFCVNQATAVITITNAPACNLVANFNYSSGANGLVNLNNTSTGTVGGTSYLWNFGDNTPTSNLVSPAHTFSANGLYTVTLVANNNFTPSCTSTKTLIVLVNSYCNLNANFTYTQGANGSVTFSNTSTGNSMFSGVSWNFGNGNTSTSQNPTTTYTANGVYSVMLTVTNFSTNPLCQDTITQVITIASNTCVANANFTLAPTTTPQFWNAIPTMTSNISNAVWSWGDNTTSNTLFTSHQYSAAGTYTICLSLTITCGATASYCNSWYIFKSADGSSSEMINVNVVAPGTTGLSNVNFTEPLLNIYPNPSNGTFNLKLDGITSEKINVSVFNSVGQKIYEENVEANNKAGQEINLGNNASGIYFIKVNAGGKTYTERILLNK